MLKAGDFVEWMEKIHPGGMATKGTYPLVAFKGTVIEVGNKKSAVLTDDGLLRYPRTKDLLVVASK